MIVVGIDSSSITASCAIIKDGKILSEGFVNNGLTHSQTLLPLITNVFNTANVKCDDVDLFAITCGPGSFTGLRIGMSTVKGMCAPFNTKCVGISTLEAAAYGVFLSGKYEKNAIISACMDARCNQVYNALFTVNDLGEFSRICDDRALLLDYLQKELEKTDKPIIFCGDGADLCFDKFKDNIKNQLIKADDEEKYVHGTAVANSAQNHIENAVDYADLIPHYLRIPQAQRELKLKLDKQQNKQ